MLLFYEDNAKDSDEEVIAHYKLVDDFLKLKGVYAFYSNWSSIFSSQKILIEDPDLVASDFAAIYYVQFL